ncbi:hypothetical protein NCY84_18620, partial [Phocaeicola vulgatus]|nr:hypothetical protein [Phocaeicola vulgatus]
LPGLKVYLERKGELPKGLVLGLAAIITYYKGGVRADGAEIVPVKTPRTGKNLKNGRKQFLIPSATHYTIGLIWN